jgi:hypothetical protein
MSDAIDQAASAFASDMGIREAQPIARAANKTASKPEVIFENFGEVENDLAAGGDDKPLPKGLRPKEDEDDEEVDPLFEGDEDEDEDEDEDGPDEGDEDDDEDEFLKREVEVMVDGEPVVVTGKEAIDGYIRQETFSRRMNQLSEAGRSVEAMAQRVAASRQQVLSMYEEAEEIMSSVIPEEPNWEQLFEKDPKGARALQVQYEGFKKTVSEIKEKREKAAREAAEKDAEETKRYQQEEFPKFAKAARWKSPKDMERDTISMRRTALAVGFTPEEVAQVYDSRMLTILLKASKFDRMIANKPKPVNTKKAAVSPGAGSKSTARKGIVGAQKQLARTGRVEDAASVFEKMIR